MRRTLLVMMAALLCFSASASFAQKKHAKKSKKAAETDTSAEPDKILYDRAMGDIKHGRHEVGRLNLQTLINTYPDSEYLAKAKLAIADSYYKESGSANMTQAIAGYKDFIVFFPFLQEASYAQLQVAMGHYQQMEKPDRDRTQAREAEAEFQIFLQKYPNDPLAPRAEQKLREVQEVLAEGDYRVGYYYYVKGDRRAAAARLLSVTKRYPLYSRSDRALWMLGDIFEKSEHKEVAANYYAQIVRNYPMSRLAQNSKGKLTAFGVPVPQPDPNALAWMQAEQNSPRGRVNFAKKPLAILHSGPGDELRAAARNGKPNLEPEADSTSATDVLTGGNQSRLGRSGGASGPGNTAVVETVTPGTSATTGANGAASGTEGAPGPGDAPAATNPPAAAATDTSGGTSPAASTMDAATKSDAAPAPDATQNTDTAKAGDTQKTNDANKNESSSKKKKGLRKIIPW